jgi:hypothetical protein
MSFLEDRKPIKFLKDSVLHGNTGQIPERYDMGIEFIEMNLKDKTRLEEFIHILQTR